MRFSRRVYASITLALALLLVASVLYFPKAGAQNNRPRFEQDLAQVFTNHEELSLDSRAVAQQVQTSGRVELLTAAHDFQLQLEPNDLRAPNYRAEEVDPDGVTRATGMPGVSTYKGNVAGVWGSDARFMVRDDKFEGMIVTPAASYFVEPAQKYSSSATASSSVCVS